MPQKNSNELDRLAWLERWDFSFALLSLLAALSFGALLTVQWLIGVVF